MFQPPLYANFKDSRAKHEQNEITRLKVGIRTKGDGCPEESDLGYAIRPVGLIYAGINMSVMGNNPDRLEKELSNEFSQPFGPYVKLVPVSL